MDGINGLYGRCPSCGHVFLVAKLPMDLTLAARLAQRAGCAMCGETRGIKVATTENLTPPEPPPIRNVPRKGGGR